MRRLVLTTSSAALAALLLFGAQASAQSVSELTVTAPPVNKYATELSYRVSYRDLDLRTTEGRDELDRRVKVSAHYVCRALQEPNIPACADDAIAKASPQVARVKKRGLTGVNFTPGDAWIPPPGEE